MKITKASGEQEEFSKEKFCKSLKDAGVPGKLVNKTCDVVAKQVKPGTRTDELFHKAREILLKENPILAGKYSLKRAIMELGPAGYLFEQYIAEILKEYGYETKTNQMMKGQCVEHETDVLAEQGTDHFIIEAKYHNKPGLKSDIQDLLYTHARFLDIEEYRESKEKKKFDHQMWFFTNTDVSSTGIKYAECKNLKVTGWDYPEEDSLKDMIDKKVLYPVTLLPAVNSYVRKEFAKSNIYFAKDLVYFSARDLEKEFGIYSNIAEDIHNQAQELVDTSK